MHYLKKENLKKKKLSCFWIGTQTLGCLLHLEPPLSESTSRAVTPEFSSGLNCTFAVELSPGPFTKSHVKVKEKNIPASANFTSDSSLLLQMQAQNTFNTRGRRVAQASRGSALRPPICSPPELTPLTSGEAVIATGVSFIRPVAQKVPFIGFTVC